MDSPAPHLLYGENLLGSAGKIWMTLVAALAVVSTQNSTVNGLASICQGMAKMNMMPRIFAKTNKHGVPWCGVVFVSVTIFIFALISNDSSSIISFLILVGSVFWMISYVLAHVDVLILRKADAEGAEELQGSWWAGVSAYWYCGDVLYDPEYFF